MFMFDLSIYYPIPQLMAVDFITLIKTLIRLAPKNPPQHVAAAIDQLKKTLADAESSMVVRIDEDLSTKLERAFDTLVDYVWNELRRRLEFAGIYNHPGAPMLSDEEREELEFDERLEEARSATKINERLFGKGTDFLRTRFSQQSTHMAARLDWIDSKELGPMLEEIVGPKLVALLKVCQRRYEAMVEERSARDGKSATDLRDLRVDLRRHIAAYCGVIGSMYKVDQPETAKVVEAALRPILIARSHTRRLGDKPEEVIEQLEQELQELADELEQELESPLGEEQADDGEADQAEADEDQNENE
jgi:hypothetical protein